MADALAAPADQHAELVKGLQGRIGCLLYAATSTRPDIAFHVQYLCRCLHRPTPALIVATGSSATWLNPSNTRSAVRAHGGQRRRHVHEADEESERVPQAQAPHHERIVTRPTSSRGGASARVAACRR